VYVNVSAREAGVSLQSCVNCEEYLSQDIGADARFVVPDAYV
jgi:hypothetical protein